MRKGAGVSQPASSIPTHSILYVPTSISFAKPAIDPFEKFLKIK